MGGGHSRTLKSVYVSRQSSIDFQEESVADMQDFSAKTTSTPSLVACTELDIKKVESTGSHGMN